MAESSSVVEELQWKGSWLLWWLCHSWPVHWLSFDRSFCSSSSPPPPVLLPHPSPSLLSALWYHLHPERGRLFNSPQEEVTLMALLITSRGQLLSDTNCTDASFSSVTRFSPSIEQALYSKNTAQSDERFSLNQKDLKEDEKRAKTSDCLSLSSILSLSLSKLPFVVFSSTRKLDCLQLQLRLRPYFSSLTFVFSQTEQWQS